jgi:hypothetical protein
MINVLSRSLGFLFGFGLITSCVYALGPNAEVSQEETLGTPPATAPDKVWVVPFATNMAEVQTDPGGPLKRRAERMNGSDDSDQPETLRGALRGATGGLLGALRGDDSTDASMVGEDAATVEDRSAALLQQDLVAALQAKGLPAEAWSDKTTWPESGVIIDGQFITIDEGSQLKRVVIGLGAGQSFLATQVQIYNMPETGQGPFLVFHTDGDSGHSPGLLVGGAVGSALTSAAVGAGVSGARASKKGTPQDLKDTASSIASYLDGYWKQQGWSETTD